MSHLIACIAAGLAVTGTGVLLLVIFKTEKDPIEDAKVKRMFPASDDPEYSVTEDNYPAWKTKTGQNN